MIMMTIINGTKIITEEIGETPARMYILEALVEGNKNGSELRRILQEKLNKTKITDPQLYYNLNKLEKHGIIKSTKIWREKKYSLNPIYIQPVRDVLNITKPKIIFFSVSDPSEVRNRLNNILRKYSIKPQKIFLIAKKSTFRGARPISNVSLIFFDESTYDKSLNFARHEIEDLILAYISNYEIIFDITYFGIATIIAITELCLKYSIKCLRFETELIWIQNIK